MKKLISIGVVLAIVAMVVLPVSAAAQGEPCAYGNVTPTTYAKIPFAILQTGLMLGGDLMGPISQILDGMGVELPLDLGTLGPIFDALAEWTGGPLSWTVDMLAWGLGMFGSLFAGFGCILTAMDVALPFDLGMVGEMFSLIACGLFTPFVCEVEGVGWNPCGADPCA